jgi:hypothetical protein
MAATSPPAAQRAISAPPVDALRSDNARIRSLRRCEFPRSSGERSPERSLHSARAARTRPQVFRSAMAGSGGRPPTRNRGLPRSSNGLDVFLRSSRPGQATALVMRRENCADRFLCVSFRLLACACATPDEVRTRLGPVSAVRFSVFSYFSWVSFRSPPACSQCTEVNVWGILAPMGLSTVF